MPSVTANPSQALAQRIVDTVRVLSIESVQRANSGHPGLPMGCADFATELWSRWLNVDPAWPEWPGRDRFVLSAGHGSMLLYSMLHLSGFELSRAEIDRFRQWESRTPGHPEHGWTPGVETTTGPLGQGLANAVGLAAAERHVAARFPGLPDGPAGHRTWVLAGDGDLMEGVASEAASLAGHWKLSRLGVFYDSNRITIDGSTDLAFSEDVGARFEAYGWHVVGPIDGHDRDALHAAIAACVEETSRPSLIVGRTHIAHGSPNFEDSNKAHGAPLGEAEVRLIKERLGFDPEKPVEVPAEVREFFAEWRATRREASDAWRRREESWKKTQPAEHAAWHRALAGELDGDPLAAAKVPAAGEKIATRSAGGSVLQVAAAAVPELLPGSADLFESNKTAIAGAKPFSDRDPAGRNVFYGVREHAMGAIANGLALHGGVRPVTSTFLVFADYMRPPIRLAALMELPVVFVFTHDSVWVGEDGPTHQPIEQLDSLRIIPGVHVVRPADARETIAAWRHALLRRHPTVLVLTRQNLPVLERAAGTPEVGLAGVVHEPAGDPRLAIVASGSEVALGFEAAAVLAKEGIPARVISVPCLEQLREAPAADVDRLLLPDVPRLVVEAATGYTWGEWVRPGDGFHGIRRFGASAPGAVVAEKLGLSAEAVTAAARKLLG